MPTGTIKKWDDERAFGFIASDLGFDVFMHAKFVKFGFVPKVGERVEFEIVTDERNARGRADNVRPADVDEKEKEEWLAEHRGRYPGGTD
jgi:CspA family cold shock protein